MTVNITEFEGLPTKYPSTGAATPQAAVLPPLAYQNVTAGETSSALQSATTLVRIATDADVRIAIGEDPDASTRGMVMYAGSSEIFAVDRRRPLLIDTAAVT